MTWVLFCPTDIFSWSFAPPDHPEDAVAEMADVVALMAPEIRKVHDFGVTAMVDFTPVGVGRRVELLKAVSEATGMRLAAPTGIHREPNVPVWIKLGVSDDGITECEATILRAAARAGKETNAIIGVHIA